MSSAIKTILQITEIPISQIRPHPQNPRGPVPSEAAQAMAESLKEAGQKTEIRVRPLSPEEREQHPGFEYLLIGGHVRLAGAKLAGLSTLRAVVVEPKGPNEEAMDALLDNRWEEMSWWQWNLAIEARLKADSGLSQRQLAAKLGFSRMKVTRALQATEHLTPTAREWVGQSVTRRDTQNKGFLITESILLALADLGSPEEVEKGLRRVLDDHMTESQVRQMVNPTPKIPKPIPTSTPVQPPSDGLKELVIGGAAGALGGFLVANLKRALGTLVRRYMLHALAALGVLAFLGFHGVGNLFKPKTADPSVTNPAPAQTAPEPQAQVPVVAAKAPAKKGPAHLTRGTHAEGQALVAPGHSAGGTGGVPVWAPEGLPLVKDFASRFYNRSYPSWEADQDYLKARMTADYGPVFLKQYYLPAQRVELRDKQEVQGFSNAQPPVVMGGQGNSAQYRVQGQITLQNRSGKMAKNLWTKPVALEISVRHEDGIGCWVEKVTEVTPNQALNAQAGVDPLKAVQDVGGEVSTVADSVAKVDKTKKLLGL